MNEGRIEQIVSPKELRERPATPFVAQFLNAAESGHCHRIAAVRI
jgi:ABC-type Fe3+/spermidine/putrescine transport system ATPase subunit